jgi:hypothetical protein
VFALFDADGTERISTQELAAVLCGADSDDELCIPDAVRLRKGRLGLSRAAPPRPAPPPAYQQPNRPFRLAPSSPRPAPRARALNPPPPQTKPCRCPPR